MALLAVSTSGPLIAASAVPALAIAFWRNLLGGAAVLPLALWRRRDELRALDRREWGLTLLAGALLAAHFATWIPAVGYTSVASATALVATQPVWSAVLARMRGHAVPRGVWWGIAVAAAGAVLLSGADVHVSGRALLGDLLALVGAVFAAAYVTTGGAVRASVSTTTYTALCYLTAAALLLVACLATGAGLSGYAGVDWLRLLGLTAGAQLLGHSLFNQVLRTTSPTVVSLTILWETPGAALIAFVFLGQRPPAAALPAVLLLLVGLALVIRSSSPAEPSGIPVE